MPAIAGTHVMCGALPMTLFVGNLEAAADCKTAEKNGMQNKNGSKIINVKQESICVRTP
jgi:hypothetical protein